MTKKLFGISNFMTIYLALSLTGVYVYPCLSVIIMETLRLSIPCAEKSHLELAVDIIIIL